MAMRKYSFGTILGLCLCLPHPVSADWSPLEAVRSPLDLSIDEAVEPNFNVSSIGKEEHLDASQTVLQVLEEGVEVSLLLELNLRNRTWRAKHGEEVELAAKNLSESWTRIKTILDLKMTDMGRPTVEQAKEIAGVHHHKPPPPAGFPVFFSVLGLLITLVAILYGPRLFDLFSPEVQSRWAVALCFALASQLALELVSALRREEGHEDTMTLYAMQLILCFVSTATTMPIAIGCHQHSPWWLTSLSLALVSIFLGIWIPKTILVGASPGEPATWNSVTAAALDDPQCLWIAFMAAFLAILLLRMLAFSAGFRCWPLRPFFLRYSMKCERYVKDLFQGKSGKVPTEAPAALLAAMLVVGSLLGISHIRVVAWAATNDAEVRHVMLSWFLSLKPLLEFIGIEPRAGALLNLMDYSALILQFSALVSLAYACWLLHRVLAGYRSTFTALVRQRNYHGKSLVDEHGPSLFNAKWATYLAGALLGNCALGSAVIGFMTLGVSVLLVTTADPAVAWAALRYAAAYALLDTTRIFIFEVAIPRHILSEDGSVLLPRVWSLLYPSLTLLSFVLGATSGAVRSCVLGPFLLLNFFRIDTTFMPDYLVDWDWSYQPFLSFVLHSHSQLNPVMRAAMGVLQKTGQKPRRRKLPRGDSHFAIAIDEEEEEEAEDGRCDEGGEERGEVSSKHAASPTKSRRRARRRWREAVVAVTRSPYTVSDSGPRMLKLKSFDSLCSSDNMVTTASGGHAYPMGPRSPHTPPPTKWQRAKLLAAYAKSGSAASSQMMSMLTSSPKPSEGKPPDPLHQPLLNSSASV